MHLYCFLLKMQYNWKLLLQTTRSIQNSAVSRIGTVCGAQTVWGGVTNMFSAHWSCDGLFVMNELHHMVMTYFYGLWEDSLESFEKEKENRKWEKKKVLNLITGLALIPCVVRLFSDASDNSVWVFCECEFMTGLVVCLMYVWDGGSVAMSPSSAGAMIIWPMWV